MFTDKEFDELWNQDNLWDRFANRSFALFDFERKILEDHIDRFFDYLEENLDHVPMLELTLFNEFISALLLSQDDVLIDIYYRACMRNSMLRNRLMEESKNEGKRDTP